MIKGEKKRMPLTMLDKLYFSKRRTRVHMTKRTKNNRHLLAYTLKDEPKPRSEK